MKTLLTTLTISTIVGCSVVYNIIPEKIYVTENSYLNEVDAVRGFFYNNAESINKLSNQQEYIGWVVKCDKEYKDIPIYRYTKGWIGGLKNVNIPIPKVDGCPTNSFVAYTS